VTDVFTFLPTGQTLAGGSVTGDTDAQVKRLKAGGTADPAFATVIGGWALLTKTVVSHLPRHPQGQGPANNC
jgi:hypothetical protein